MRIDSQSPDKLPGREPTAPQVSARNRITGTQASGSAGAANPPSSDRLVFSAQAAEFLRIRPQLEALPAPSREERINRLRAQVAGGTYAVDGQQVAGAMLRDDSVASVVFGSA